MVRIAQGGGGETPQSPQRQETSQPERKILDNPLTRKVDFNISVEQLDTIHSFIGADENITGKYEAAENYDIEELLKAIKSVPNIDKAPDRDKRIESLGQKVDKTQIEIFFAEIDKRINKALIELDTKASLIVEKEKLGIFDGWVNVLGHLKHYDSPEEALKDIYLTKLVLSEVKDPEFWASLGAWDYLRGASWALIPGAAGFDAVNSIIPSWYGLIIAAAAGVVTAKVQLNVGANAFKAGRDRLARNAIQNPNSTSSLRNLDMTKQMNNAVGEGFDFIDVIGKEEPVDIQEKANFRRRVILTLSNRYGALNPQLTQLLNNGTKLNTDVFWRELFNILRTNDDFRRDVYFFEEINNRAGNRVIGGINTGINGANRVIDWGSQNKTLMSKIISHINSANRITRQAFDTRVEDFSSMTLDQFKQRIKGYEAFGLNNAQNEADLGKLLDFLKTKGEYPNNLVNHILGRILFEGELPFDDNTKTNDILREIRGYTITRDPVTGVIEIRNAGGHIINPLQYTLELPNEPRKFNLEEGVIDRMRQLITNIQNNALPIEERKRSMNEFQEIVRNADSYNGFTRSGTTGRGINPNEALFNAEKTNGEAIIRGIHIPDPRLVTELRNINDANLNDRFQKLEQFRTAHWEEIRKDPASRKELMIKELRTISYVTNLALRKEKYDLFNTNYGLYAKEIGNIVRRVKVEEVTIGGETGHITNENERRVVEEYNKVLEDHGKLDELIRLKTKEENLINERGEIDGRRMTAEAKVNSAVTEVNSANAKVNSANAVKVTADTELSNAPNDISKSKKGLLETASKSATEILNGAKTELNGAKTELKEAEDKLEKIQAELRVKDKEIIDTRGLIENVELNASNANAIKRASSTRLRTMKSTGKLFTDFFNGNITINGATPSVMAALGRKFEDYRTKFPSPSIREAFHKYIKRPKF